MRFSTRDLLEVTTVVAIYAAGLSVLHSRGLLRIPQGPALILAVTPIAAFLVFFVGRTLLKGGSVGQLHSVFRTSWAKKWHLGCLAVFVVLTAVALVNNDSVAPPMLMLPLLFHASLEASGRVAIGSNGVSMQGVPHEYSVYRFEYDDATRRLHTIPRRGVRPWATLVARTVLVPDEEAEKVSVLFAEHQRPEEETADTRG